MKYAPIVVLAVCAALPARAGEAQDWQRAVEILQYLQSDYPNAVKGGEPTELEEQRAFAKEASEAIAALGAQAERFVPQIQSIEARIDAAKDPEGVSRDCAALVEGLVQAGGLARSPNRAPDLEHGKALYRQDCAVCHGASGNADTVAAKQLNPPPANFRSDEVMGSLTPFKAFNVMTFGVRGTAMPSYSSLSEDDRWALAFYLFGLRQPPCQGKPPRVSLESLANSTDGALQKAYGAEAVSCLRQKVPEPDEEKSLLVARSGVEQALELARAGKHDEARRAVLDAYLSGIEPVEALLKSRNPDLVARLEAGFGQVRVAAQKGSPTLDKDAKALLSLIDQARQSHSKAASFASVFWLSALVIVREGFEATVVLAALLAVLKKMRQEQQAKVVHAAWISALVLGVALFIFGRAVLGGAHRELLEGGTALVAVAMLLYAALWLNAKSNVRKFMGELREKMQGALGKNSSVGLFSIAFLAMFRECFETVLFLQGLSLDSPAGAAWGAALGVLAMIALVAFVNRVGYRLPMKQLFTASTVVLFATAVILLGEGLHALQEVGVLAYVPMPGVRLEWLGIYPDVVSFVPQLVLALLPLPFVWIKRHLGGPQNGLAGQKT